MLGRLRDRLHSIQDGIASSVNSLASVPVQTGVVVADAEHLQAGGELLHHWQDCWESLHSSHEENARLASRCDKTICKVKARADRQWAQMKATQELLGHVPQMNSQVAKAMETLGVLESAFSNVEVALLTLEDTVEATELQKRQTGERLQLALHQEKKRVALEEVALSLRSRYESKRREAERSSRLEKQKVDQSQSYRANANALLLPVRQNADPDASLETVDLNEEESHMERFLSDDLLDDASPLPRDEDQRLVANLVPYDCHHLPDPPEPPPKSVVEVTVTSPLSGSALVGQDASEPQLL